MMWGIWKLVYFKNVNFELSRYNCCILTRKVLHNHQIHNYLTIVAKIHCVSLLVGISIGMSRGILVKVEI